MAKPFQFLLLACGVIALLAVGGEILYSIAATTHGSTPVRVVQVQAGPYPLTVSLYTYPAHASYALPFAIAPHRSISGALTYDVTSIPDESDVQIRTCAMACRETRRSRYRDCGSLISSSQAVPVREKQSSL